MLALAYSSAIGPFRGPDERNHFLRAYQISEGRLASTYRSGEFVGDDLPASLGRLSAVLEDHKEHRITPAQLEEARGLIFDAGDRQFTEFSTAMYAPLAYVPSAAAIAAGRAAGARPLTLLYLARWGNMLAASLLIALALAYAGYATPAAAVIALFPMMIAQVAVVSADGLSFGIGFLWLGVLMSTALRGSSKVTGGRVIFIVLLALGLSQLRPPFPLLGLLALVLMRRGADARSAAPIVAAAIAASLIPATAWNSYAKQFYSRPLVAENVNPAEQFRHVAQNPGGFLQVVKRDLGRRAYEYWRQAVGRLGWLNLWLPEWIPLGFLCVFLAALCCGSPVPPAPSTWHRWLFAAAAAIGVLGIQLALYATFNGVGSRHLRGIQGRYFIPILFVAAFAASNQLLSRLQRRGPLLLTAGVFITCAHLAALAALSRAAAGSH